MALSLVINLTDVEELALKYVAADPQEWIDSFVKYRITVAIDEIYQKEVARIIGTGAESIPTNKEAVVQAAFDQGYVLTVVQANALALQEMQNQQAQMSSNTEPVPAPTPDPTPTEPTP